MDIQVIINVMVKLLFMLILGYIVNRAGILDEAANKRISGLIVNLTSPLLVLSSVCMAETKDKQRVLYILLIGAVIYIILPFIAKLYVKVMKIRDGEKGTYQFMIIFANTAFMGYPVVQSVFGDEAVFFTSMLHMAFNIILFSYGIYIITMDCEKKNEQGFSMKKIINPGMIFSILAFIVYFTGFKFPTIIVETMYTVGNVTTPLSMIVLGSSLALISVREVFADKKIYVLTLMRLIVLPVLIYYGLRLFGIDDYIVGIATLTFGMPVASMAVMMSNEYDGNVSLASRAVFITTTASVVTIPVLVQLFFC